MKLNEIKLLTDENISPNVVFILRKIGVVFHDAVIFERYQKSVLKESEVKKGNSISKNLFSVSSCLLLFHIFDPIKNG
jgi:hypothetical protein